MLVILSLGDAFSRIDKGVKFFQNKVECTILTKLYERSGTLLSFGVPPPDGINDVVGELLGCGGHYFLRRLCKLISGHCLRRQVESGFTM